VRRTALRECLVVAAAWLVASCATAPPAPVAPDAADRPFVLEGRLSAKRGSEGFAGSFVWQHASERDVIALNSPLGQTVARLSGGAAQARIEFADGTSAEAGDWEVLTTRALAVPLPVAGLAWWIRGVPHPRSAYTVEPDAAGRALVLRQDGWEIVYGYGGDGQPLPTRVRLAWPDVDVRFALDRWQ
jgi:outer membrane lipoprotein LolB